MASMNYFLIMCLSSDERGEGEHKFTNTVFTYKRIVYNYR